MRDEAVMMRENRHTTLVSFGREPAMLGDAQPKSLQNELRVLHFIHANRTISRVDLVKRTGWSPASVTGIVRRLISKGLVVESGKNSSNLGRRPVSLSVSKNLG